MSSNLFGQFKIYPRGFLGAKLEPVLINQKAPKTGRLQYDVSVFDATEGQLVTANVAIEEAYAAVIRGDVKTGDFQFREDVLKVIFKAFGTLDFEGWYMAQYQSPSFGEQQRDFLEDCLRFIWTGKRKMSLENWDALLSASDTRISDIELPEMARGYFNKQFVRQLAPTNRTMLPGLVQDWIAKPNGFADLLVSCHILFGIKR